MTDVELLPLPEPFVSDLMHGDLYTPEQVRAYARTTLSQQPAPEQITVAELLEVLMQANSQMELAADCIEAGRISEALLHVCSLSRQRKAAIAKATGTQQRKD
jgi:hypothetical protein